MSVRAFGGEGRGGGLIASTFAEAVALRAVVVAGEVRARAHVCLGGCMGFVNEVGWELQITY